MVSVFDILVVAWVAGLPAQENPSVEGPLFLAWLVCMATFVGACAMFLYGLTVLYVIPLLRGRPAGDDSADVIGRFLSKFF